MAEKTGSNNTALIIGGVLVLGVATYFIVRSMGQKQAPAPVVQDRTIAEVQIPDTTDADRKKQTREQLIAAGVTLASLGIGEIVRRKQEKKSAKTTRTGLA